MSTYKFQYRPIRPDDLGKLVRFCSRWSLEEQFKKNELRDYLLKGIKFDENANFLAEIEGKIIGVSMCHAPGEWLNIKSMRHMSPGSWGVELSEIGYIKILLIHEKYRHRGIGTKLSKYSIQALKNMGAKAVLGHEPEMPGETSKQFLARLGFFEVAKHKRFWPLTDLIANEMVLKI